MRHLEQHGDFDVARAGWIADYKDPENFLALCKTGTGNNYAEYSNKEYRRSLAAAAAAADPAERMKKLSEAEAIGVARDLCVLPLLYYGFHTVVSNKLKGWEDNVMDRPSHPLHEQGITRQRHDRRSRRSGAAIFLAQRGRRCCATCCGGF